MNNVEKFPELYKMYQELSVFFASKNAIVDKPITEVSDVVGAEPLEDTDECSVNFDPPVVPVKKVDIVKEETSTKQSIFTSAQILSMKELKSKLKIKENDQLNPFIEEWSQSKVRSVSGLNASNIDSFITFMKKYTR